ncbi:MAG: RNA-binding protein [Caldicoprobacterales bacterium]
MVEDNKMQVGRIVLAKAGRDKGNLFVIVDRIDHEYVLIANGRNRTIDKPKKKKIKHLEARPDVLSGIREKLLRGQKVFDAEIRKGLDALL